MNDTEETHSITSGDVADFGFCLTVGIIGGIIVGAVGSLFGVGVVCGLAAAALITYGLYKQAPVDFMQPKPKAPSRAAVMHLPTCKEHDAEFEEDEYGFLFCPDCESEELSPEPVSFDADYRKSVQGLDS